MRKTLSLSGTLGAVAIAAMLCGPQAFAKESDYSTDMEEPDIMTVKNDHCCDNEKLKEESNVELKVGHAVLTTIKPVNVQVLDNSQQVVAEFNTRNRVVYMHLPEGEYTIKVNGLLDHTKVNVDASDNTLKDYVL